MSKFTQRLVFFFLVVFLLFVVACTGPSDVIPIPTTTLTPTLSPTPTKNPDPTSTPKPTPSDVPIDDTGISADLAAFLADPVNGQSVGERSLDLHGGIWENACVITVSEALRRLNCDIPRSTDYTTELIGELENHGFTKSDDLKSLQAGAICFTTDADGSIGIDPTHTFIFLSWAEPGVMNIYDNQVNDYGSQYHTRLTGQHFLNDDPVKIKDATAYYYYR